MSNERRPTRGEMGLPPLRQSKADVRARDRDAAVSQWAAPIPALCMGMPHRWWPLSGADARACGVRSQCLRCGCAQPRPHTIAPLGRVRARYAFALR